MEEIMDLRGKISNGNVVVIDFFGENCPSCKKIDPVLRELSNEMEVDFFKFNSKSAIDQSEFIFNLLKIVFESISICF